MSELVKRLREGVRVTHLSHMDKYDIDDAEYWMAQAADKIEQLSYQLDNVSNRLERLQKAAQEANQSWYRGGPQIDIAVKMQALKDELTPF